MGEIRILTALGDEPLTWDPDDKASVRAAYKRWEKLKKDGYEFFAVEETKGRKLTRFDKKLGRVIAAPGGRTKADKASGTRTRAMAGGPTLRSG